MGLRSWFLLWLALTLPAPAAAENALKVMTLNIWGGGLHAGHRVADMVAVLKAVDADVIALQEAWRPEGSNCAVEDCITKAPSLACAIARDIGYHCHDQITPGAQGWNAVLSRYPIRATDAGGLAVRIDLRGQEIALINLHLPDRPYQPYQLLRVAHGGGEWLETAEAAVAAADAARGREVDRVLREIEALGDMPILVMGDFNEPSHRDWTPRAVAAGRAPLPVTWPSVRRLEERGFIDAYRAVRPDETRDAGATWTALPHADERPERIDFILARGLTIVATAVVGESAETADLVVRPWPSDHRGVMATVVSARPALRSIRIATER
jgi:exodeoxyribonuclease III